MGCLFAAKLAQAGNQVLLVDHDTQTVSAIRKNGVRIKDGQTRKKVDLFAGLAILDSNTILTNGRDSLSVMIYQEDLVSCLSQFGGEEASHCSGANNCDLQWLELPF